MLSNLRLMFYLPELISAVKNTVSDFHSEICWTNEGQFTIQVTGLYSGNFISAWGCDKNEAVAFGKAIMELAERIHMAQSPRIWKNLESGVSVSHTDLQDQHPILSVFCETTSGMAAHLSQSSATSGAIAELIERHVLTKATLECNPPHSRVNDQYLWNGPMGHMVALATCRPTHGGVLFSSSAGRSKSEALKGAQRELSAMREWATNSANIKELIATHQAGRPSEIQAYYLTQSPDMSFLGQTSNEIVSPHITASDVWVTSLPVLPGFEKIPSFCVVRAFSPLMQPLQFGPLRDAVINPLAIDLARVSPTVEYNVVA